MTEAGHFGQRENLRNDVLDEPHAAPFKDSATPPRQGTARKTALGFVRMPIRNNIPHGVEQVKRLLRLGWLPHLIQLARIRLHLIQEPMQVVEHENLVQSECRVDAVDADLDHLKSTRP
jgi:hypothetical protein